MMIYNAFLSFGLR